MIAKIKSYTHKEYKHTLITEQLLKTELNNQQALIHLSHQFTNCKCCMHLFRLNVNQLHGYKLQAIKEVTVTLSPLTIA